MYAIRSYYARFTFLSELLLSLDTTTLPDAAARVHGQAIEPPHVGDQEVYGGAEISVSAAIIDRLDGHRIEHHLVDRETGAVTVTKADPHDPRGQALEGDALARHVEPAVQVRA